MYAYKDSIIADVDMRVAEEPIVFFDYNIQYKNVPNLYCHCIFTSV